MARSCATADVYHVQVVVTFHNIPWIIIAIPGTSKTESTSNIFARKRQGKQNNTKRQTELKARSKQYTFMSKLSHDDRNSTTI